MTKIAIDKSVLEQVLEALEAERDNYQTWDEEDGAPEYIYESITALRQAMEQPAQQEPADDKALTLATWLQANYEADEIDEAAGELRRLYGENRMLWKEREEPHRQLEFYVRECNRLESERDSALLVQSAQHEPVDHAVIAGALFDFLGWLTSRQQRVTWSSCDDATTAIDAVIEFAKMRGLSLDEVHVLDWQDRIQAEEVLPRPVIDKSAAIRIATALGWEPKREPLTNGEIEELFKDGLAFEHYTKIARAIEAKLKEKNCG